MAIKITGIRIERDAFVGENRIVAFFDLDLEGILQMRGCAWVSGKEQMMVWSPPCVRKPNEPERAIRFSNQLRTKLNRIVADAVRAFEQQQAANDTNLSAMVELVREIEERDAA